MVAEDLETTIGAAFETHNIRKGTPLTVVLRKGVDLFTQHEQDHVQLANSTTFKPGLTVGGCIGYRYADSFRLDQYFGDNGRGELPPNRFVHIPHAAIHSIMHGCDTIYVAKGVSPSPALAALPAAGLPAVPRPARSA